MSLAETVDGVGLLQAAAVSARLSANLAESWDVGHVAMEDTEAASGRDHGDSARSGIGDRRRQPNGRVISRLQASDS